MEEVIKVSWSVKFEIGQRRIETLFELTSGREPESC